MTNRGIDGPATPGSRLAGLHNLSAASYGSEPQFDPRSNLYTLRKGPRFNPAVHGYNLTPDLYLKWRTALANVRTGTAGAKLVHVGDSTTYGTGPVTSPIASSYPARLTALLNSYCAPAISAIPAPAGNADDSRVTLGTGWTGNGLFSGSGWTAGASATGNLSITPTVAFDTITVYYSRNPGLGTSAVDVDGGASLGNLVTAGTPQAIGTATFSCTLGTHTIHFGPPTATMQINMIEVSNSANKTIVTYGLGVGASTGSTWAAGGAAWALGQWVPFLAPDLTTIELTINDNIAQTNLAAYQSGIKAIITQAKVTGDVLLVRGVRNQVLAENPDYADKQTAILYALAEDNSCGLIDLPLRYGTANIPGFGSGGVHWNPAGYADKAAAYYNALRIIS